jgi:ferrous iron transport protein B
MATIYSIGSRADEETVRQKLASARHPETGLPVYTPAVALSLLLFYVFALQCMSTMAVVRRETGSWKWPLLQFGWMTATAYLASFLAFHALQNT